MKRKKHPRLPNGLGSIKYLGTGRSNPYAVYVPDYYITPAGSMVYKRALCYVPDWYTGFAVLISYKAGTYKPGDEIMIAKKAQTSDPGRLDDLSRQILADYRYIQNGDIAAPTLQDAWDEYTEHRFGVHAAKKYAEATFNQYDNARKFFDGLMSRRLPDISLSELQAVVDSMSEKYSAAYVRVVIAAVSNVYSYAMDHDYIKTDYSKRLAVPMIAKQTTPREPFSRRDLRTLWRQASDGDRMAQALIVHCYSGFRLSAFYDDFIVDRKNLIFEGGVKTYRRPVPILPEILPFVRDPVYPVRKGIVNKEIHAFCDAHGLAQHSSHDCRHTFKTLLDRYGVAPVAQRVLMGHSTGRDVHDAIYTHFDVDDLRREMSKIKIEM